MQSLPDKVKLGCVSYPVRDFVPILSCQAYGHVPAVCRREIPRCEKCAGGHETKECKECKKCIVLVEKVVCVNCRGTPSAGDQKCPLRERQGDVAGIRVV